MATIKCPNGHSVEIDNDQPGPVGRGVYTVTTRYEGDRIVECDACVPFVLRADGTVASLTPPTITGLHIRARVKNAFRDLLARRGR